MVCGYEPPEELWRGDGFAFSRCPSCELIYQYPRPKQEELVYRYDADYFSYELENEEAFYGLMEKALADVRFYREVEPKAVEASFLDVGCATGKLLEKMKQRGWREQGVEVCAPSAEYGMRERGVRIRIGTLEEAHFASAEFDVVHASHLIEHLADPPLFMEEVSRILKPGGTVILTTPNAGGLQARLFAEKWRSAIADHMYLFSLRTLTRLLENHGFIIERRKTWGGMAAGIAPEWVKRVLDAGAKRFGFGDVMVIRARKPCA